MKGYYRNCIPSEKLSKLPEGCLINNDFSAQLNNASISIPNINGSNIKGCISHCNPSENRTCNDFIGNLKISFKRRDLRSRF